MLVHVLSCMYMYTCHILVCMFDCVSSISVTSSSITKSDIPEEMKFDWTNMTKGDEIEMHSLLLMDQSSFEGTVFFAWFNFSQISQIDRKRIQYYYPFAKIWLANTLFCTLSRKLHGVR